MHTASRKAGIVLAVCGALMCASCRQHTVLHQYTDVDLWGWGTDDTLTFTLPKTVNHGELDVKLGVRTTSSFKYNTLHMLTIISRDDEVIEQDTIFVPMFDSNGQLTGDGFPYVTTMKPLPTLHVDSGHVYTYSVLHLMQEPRVKGIKDIGLEIYEP